MGDDMAASFGAGRQGTIDVRCDRSRQDNYEAWCQFRHNVARNATIWLNVGPRATRGVMEAEFKEGQGDCKHGFRQ